MNLVFRAAGLLLTAGTLLASPSSVNAQGVSAMPGSVKVASVLASVKPASMKRGGKGVLAITLVVAPSFHVNAHKPADPDLIGTDFAPTPMPSVVYGAARFPAAKSLKVGYEKQPMAVYTGRAVIQVPFTVAASARPGPLALGGSVTFQGCNATACYPPQTVLVKATVAVK